MLATVASFVDTQIVRAVNIFFPAVHAGWTSDKGSSLSLDELIQKGLNIALAIAGVVAVAYLIWNGIRYIMSQGDAGKAKEAQQGMTNAVIGLVVALVAFVLVQFVFNALNAELGESIDDFESTNTTVVNS